MNFTITLDATPALVSVANSFANIMAVLMSPPQSGKSIILTALQRENKDDAVEEEMAISEPIAEKIPVPEDEADEEVNSVTTEPKPEKPSTAAPAKEAKSEKASTKYTLSDVRAMVGKKTSEGKRVEMKTLLTSYGVPNVAALPPDKYDEFMAEAEAI